MCYSNQVQPWVLCSISGRERKDTLHNYWREEHKKAKGIHEKKFDKTADYILYIGKTENREKRGSHMNQEEQYQNKSRNNQGGMGSHTQLVKMKKKSDEVIY